MAAPIGSTIKGTKEQIAAALKAKGFTQDNKGNFNHHKLWCKIESSVVKNRFICTIGVSTR